MINNVFSVIPTIDDSSKWLTRFCSLVYSSYISYIADTPSYMSTGYTSPKICAHINIPFHNPYVLLCKYAMKSWIGQNLSNMKRVFRYILESQIHETVRLQQLVSWVLDPLAFDPLLGGFCPCHWRQNFEHPLLVGFFLTSPRPILRKIIGANTNTKRLFG